MARRPEHHWNLWEDAERAGKQASTKRHSDKFGSGRPDRRRVAVRPTPSCSRLSFEGRYSHHYVWPAHIPTPDLWRRRLRHPLLPNSTKGSKRYTTSCQNVSNHRNCSYRTSLVRHSAPTLTILAHLIVAQEGADRSMQLPSRARLSKVSRWLSNTVL
jgi:hypothetical protein